MPHIVYLKYHLSLLQTIITFLLFNNRTDTQNELDLIRKIAIELGVKDALPSTHWSHGGKGALDLAKAIVEATNSSSSDKKFKFLYELDKSIIEKIEIIAKEMYG